uniref:Putative secreted protein n=1 Tax=Rhipicephalus microplus TaxID=6941 RepID=A0A6M2DB69_RHIMP
MCVKLIIQLPAMSVIAQYFASCAGVMYCQVCFYIFRSAGLNKESKVSAHVSCVLLGPRLAVRSMYIDNASPGCWIGY